VMRIVGGSEVLEDYLGGCQGGAAPHLFSAQALHREAEVDLRDTHGAVACDLIADLLGAADHRALREGLRCDPPLLAEHRMVPLRTASQVGLGCCDGLVPRVIAVGPDYGVPRDDHVCSLGTAVV